MDLATEQSAPFAIESIDGQGGLHLSGSLTMPNAAAIWSKLREATRHLSRGRTRAPFAIDLARVDALDGGVMSLLVALRADLALRGVQADIVRTPDAFRPLIDLYEAESPPPRPKKRPPESMVAHVGRATAALGTEAKGVVSFFGEMLLAVVGLVRHPRSGHWKEIPPLMEKTGADALPIVLLLNFLVGFVMAYQSANQLKAFGANIYVADLIGISVTRELAPLMTAIIVAGRSGAAFAAEIGSMKVSEEIDALRTLGLRPFSWLVVPRVISLMIVVPALTIVADIIGTLGGLVVGVTSLGLTAKGYFNETRTAVQLWDIQHGIMKSVLFALAIGLIACQQGFATTGGAEGVGRRTTSTVVSCLFAIVLIDALATMISRVMGL